MPQPSQTRGISCFFCIKCPILHVNLIECALTQAKNSQDMNAIDTKLKPPVIGTPIVHDFDYVYLRHIISFVDQYMK